MTIALSFGIFCGSNFGINIGNNFDSVQFTWMCESVNLFNTVCDLCCNLDNKQ